MKKLSLIFLLALMWCNVGFAYTAKGSVSCGTVISSYKKNAVLTDGMMTAYVNGFLTGRNYETNGNVGKGVDNESIFYALLKYCRENPLKDNVDAAEYIYRELK